MRADLGGLWRRADFRRLWAARTISLLGSQVGTLALPLVAAASLGATPAQMGLLAAAGSLPTLLFGLIAGVWVDRRRRRPLLIATDLGRGVLLLTIPAAALGGILRIEWLYAVAFLVGSFALIFDIAAQSFLPTLLRREELVEGNSKLEVGRSAAEIAGPGLAGALVQLATAPLAIIADALSFGLSALCVATIRALEPAPAPAKPGERLWQGLGEGLRVVLRPPALRAVVGATAILTFFNGVLEAVSLLYLTRGLGLTPALLGLAFVLGSAGFLVGALLTERSSARLGVGPTLIGGLALAGLSDLLVPLAGGGPLLIVATVAAAQFLFGLGLLAYNINAVSLRQASVPAAARGRANATVLFLSWGLVPLGALAGGLLGERLGLRPTLVLAAAGELLAVVWLLASPVRTLRRLPELAEEEVAVPAASV